MTQVSSEIQDIAPKDGNTDSETSLRAPLCEDTLIQESVLRSMIEEKAFQALSERFLRKGPRQILCSSEPDKDEDIFSSTFPRKLWKIVGSEQFKSVWWDETGTSIVIDEELFKKEVLERKAPFRIFATGSMKSLIRQLNLYGFSKLRHCVKRSASLAEFLAEDREAPALSKILYYHNPNFKRGCPHLLLKMKRRIGIKSATSGSSTDQDSSKKPLGGGRNVNKHNSGLASGTHEDGLLSSSTNLNVPPLQTSTSQITANTNAPIRSEFYPLSTLIDPAGQKVIDKHATFNQLTISHMYTARGYSQANSQIVNFVKTTTFISQCHLISPLQNNCFGRMVPPSTFASQDPQLPVSEVPPPNLQSTSSIWYQMPSMTPEAPADSLQFSTSQLSSSYEHLPNYK